MADKKWCSFCYNTKKQNCSSCTGGYTPCYRCNRSGYIYTSVQKPNGYGGYSLQNIQSRCPSACYNGTVKCLRCGGCGKMTCESCRWS